VASFCCCKSFCNLFTFQMSRVVGRKQPSWVKLEWANSRGKLTSCFIWATSLANRYRFRTVAVPCLAKRKLLCAGTVVMKSGKFLMYCYRYQLLLVQCYLNYWAVLPFKTLAECSASRSIHLGLAIFKQNTGRNY
jgi:hypothetical protein